MTTKGVDAFARNVVVSEITDKELLDYTLRRVLSIKSHRKFSCMKQSIKYNNPIHTLDWIIALATHTNPRCK